MRAYCTIAVIAALFAALGPRPAQAETAPLVRNERIIIEYLEPRHPVFAYYTDADDPAQAKEHETNVKTYQRYSAIMERLKSRRVMEEFSQFLAPLKLPITLRLRTMQCGEVNAFYDPADSSINLCYEFVADIEDRAPRATTPRGSRATKSSSARSSARCCTRAATPSATCCGCRCSVARRTPPTRSPRLSCCSSAARSRAR